MKDLCKIKGRDYTFVINKETGLWAIVTNPNIDIEELGRELVAPSEKKEYSNIGLFAINTTTACNLDCSYCSVGKIKCEPKGVEKGVGEMIVERALESKDYPFIIFHGSESLLNFQGVKQIVEYGDRRAKELGKKINFSIQSNLTVLTDEMLDFIKERGIGVSTSLDGVGDLHNTTRSYVDGSPSYDDVMRNIKRVLKVQEGMSVVTVITKHNVGSLSEIVLEFEKEGITSVQFTPIIPKGNGENKGLAPRAKNLTKAYIDLFEQTVRRLVDGQQKIQVKNLSQYLSSFFFRTPMDTCTQCGQSTEHPLVAIDTNGDVYPCDFFWGDEFLKTGNIVFNGLQDLVNSPADFRLSRDINKSSCKSCTWKRLCGGGCAADIFVTNGNFNGKSHHCSTHNAAFTYLAKNLRYLAEANILSDILSWTTNNKEIIS